MKKLIGLMLLVVGFLLLAYQVYRFAARESIVFDLVSIQAAHEAQLRLPLTPLFGAVSMFAGVVLIVRDRDRAS